MAEVYFERSSELEEALEPLYQYVGVEVVDVEIK